MPYTPNHDYDVFVSYARADDIDEFGHGSGWISEFVQYLESVLRSRLGGTSELKIYYDNRSLQSNHQVAEVQRAARSSAAFMAVASPAYVSPRVAGGEKPWTLREMEAFCEATEDLKRLFVVEYLPLEGGQDYPPTLRDQKRQEFWEVDPDVHVALPLVRGTTKYRGRMSQLAQQMASQLIAIRKRDADGARAARPARPDPINLIADQIEADHDRELRDAKGVVFVAQAAGTAELDADRLTAQLREDGYLVHYAANFRQGGAEFRAEAQAALAEADVYVQLLGLTPGRKPPDVPEGYVVAQYQMAKDAGCEKLLWRRPDVPPESDDLEYEAVLNDPIVTVSGFGQLREMVGRLIEEARQDEDEPPPSRGMIFINVDRKDVEAGQNLQEELVKRGIDSVLPLFDGSPEEIHADLTENLVECDTMLLLYGAANLPWVRAQMRIFSKLKARMRARIKAVCVGPPDGKSTDFGFRSSDLKLVDVAPDWRIEPILELIAVNG